MTTELRWYIVTGRVPYDDEDTQEIIHAASAEDACDEYRKRLHANDEPDDPDADDDDLTTTCPHCSATIPLDSNADCPECGDHLTYILYVVECDTEPRTVVYNP